MYPKPMSELQEHAGYDICRLRNERGCEETREEVLSGLDPSTSCLISPPRVLQKVRNDALILHGWILGECMYPPMVSLSCIR